MRCQREAECRVRHTGLYGWTVTLMCVPCMNFYVRYFGGGRAFEIESLYAPAQG